MASIATTAVFISVMTFVLQLVNSIPVEINGSGDEADDHMQLFGGITSHDTFQRGKRAMKVSSRSCSSHADCGRNQCCAFHFGRKVCKDSNRVRNLGETCSLIDIHTYLDLHDMTRSFTSCPLVCSGGFRCRRTKSGTRKAVCSRR